MCFIDYAKALYCVNWKMLFKVVAEMGVLAHIAVDLAKSSYEFNSIVVNRKLFEQRRGCVKDT